MSEYLYFTEKGIKKLRDEISELEKKLTKVQHRTAEAAETGGNQWHDNADYEQITIDVRGLDKRIVDARKLLNKAKIISAPISTEKVAIGTGVEILFNGNPQKWIIGGFGESDPALKVVAYNTPLAQLLLRKMVGEISNGKIGGKEAEIKIIDIFIP